MDAILVDDCTSGRLSIPLWDYSKQPPTTLVFQFGSQNTLATSSKVINMLNLMTKHNGIIIGSNFRKVKISILAPFLVFPIFDPLIVVRSFYIVRHANRRKISHLQTPLILLYYQPFSSTPLRGVKKTKRTTLFWAMNSKIFGLKMENFLAIS